MKQTKETTKFRGLIREQLVFPNVSTYRFFHGIFLGIVTSISFYLFFYMSREITRYMFSTSEHYDLWVLTEKEALFYNLVFAFISSIFGEGICLKTWYEKPNQGYSPYFDYKRKTIIHDVLVLNTNFLNVFAKVAVVYGIWFGETFGYLETSLFPKYNLMWILLILVLHLEQWKSIRLIFKNKCLKGFGLASLSIVLLSVLLSLVNPVDSRSADKNYLSKSIDYNYKIERPVSFYADWIRHYYTLLDIYYVFPRNTDSIKSKPEILIYNKPIKADELCSVINQKMEWLSEFEKSDFTVHLHCDKELKMKHIKTLKAELSKCGVKNISYASVPSDFSYPHRVCRYMGIENKLAGYAAYNSPERFNIEYYKKPRIISIDIMDSAFVSMDGLLIAKKHFKNAFMQNLYSASFRQIQLHASDSVDYQTYIYTRDCINYGILKWRNSKSINDFGKKYDQLLINDRIKFDLKYYFTYFELTDVQKEILAQD